MRSSPPPSQSGTSEIRCKWATVAWSTLYATPHHNYHCSRPCHVVVSIGLVSNYYPTKLLSLPFLLHDRSELQSFLVEITSIILGKKDEKGAGYIVDKIVDQTGSKGTGDNIIGHLLA